MAQSDRLLSCSATFPVPYKSFLYEGALRVLNSKLSPPSSEAVRGLGCSPWCSAGVALHRHFCDHRPTDRRTLCGFLLQQRCRLWFSNLILFFFFGSDEGVGCQAANGGFLLKEQKYFVSSATSGYVPEKIESRELKQVTCIHMFIALFTITKMQTTQVSIDR